MKKNQRDEKRVDSRVKENAKNPIREISPTILPFDLTAELGGGCNSRTKKPRRILHCDPKRGRYSRVSRGICCDS